MFAETASGRAEEQASGLDGRPRELLERGRIQHGLQHLSAGNHLVAGRTVFSRLVIRDTEAARRRVPFDQVDGAAQLEAAVDDGRAGKTSLVAQRVAGQPEGELETPWLPA